MQYLCLWLPIFCFPLLDTGSFALAATQIEQTGTTNFTQTNQFNFVDVGGQNWKNPLNTHTV